MKNIVVVAVFLLSCLQAYAGTVSTLLNSDDADVDDALVLDSKGNVYGSNFAGDSVYKISPKGEVSVFTSNLQNPNGLAFDQHENLFVVEYSTGFIHKYDYNGNFLNSFFVGGYPSGLIKDFHSKGMIYTNVADNSVNKLLPDGSIEVIHQGAPLNVPVGLAFDKRGTLYIGNYIGREIYGLSSRDGDLSYVATVPDSGTDAPYLAFITYANGRLFGTVYGEHKIYVIHPKKIDQVSVFAGSDYGDVDGDLSVATFSYPAGIVADRHGKTLYVSEYTSLGNIRKISKRRKHSTVPKFDKGEYPGVALSAE